MIRALCKYNGYLIIAEFSKCEDEKNSKCPECMGEKFSYVNGWFTCHNCGFAIEENNYREMVDG